MVLVSVAALVIGVGVGMVVASSDSTPQGPGSSAGIRAMSFDTKGPAARRIVLELGGLTITAACRRSGDPPFDYLSVTAASGLQGASIVSSFLQREGAKGASTYPYVFALRDFGPAYGDYDFLGTPYKAAGDLHYSRPDGGQVSVSYATNQQRTTDGCNFTGTAVYAPD